MGSNRQYRQRELLPGPEQKLGILLPHEPRVGGGCIYNMVHLFSPSYSYKQQYSTTVKHKKNY